MEFSARTGTTITVPNGRSQALEWKMERYGIAVAFGLIAMPWFWRLNSARIA